MKTAAQGSFKISASSLSEEPERKIASKRSLIIMHSWVFPIWRLPHGLSPGDCPWVMLLITQSEGRVSRTRFYRCFLSSRDLTDCRSAKREVSQIWHQLQKWSTWDLPSTPITDTHCLKLPAISEKDNRKQMNFSSLRLLPRTIICLCGAKNEMLFPSEEWRVVRFFKNS